MCPNVRAPQFLIIERYVQSLSHRVCMGDKGSGWWAPVVELSSLLRSRCFRDVTQRSVTSQKNGCEGDCSFREKRGSLTSQVFFSKHFMSKKEFKTDLKTLNLNFRSPSAVVLFREINLNNAQPKPRENPIAHASIPYVKGVSERIRQILNPKTLRQLSNYLKH